MEYVENTNSNVVLRSYADTLNEEKLWSLQIRKMCMVQYGGSHVEGQIFFSTIP